MSGVLRRPRGVLPPEGQIPDECTSSRRNRRTEKYKDVQTLSPYSKWKNSRMCVVHELPAKSLAVPDCLPDSVLRHLGACCGRRARPHGRRAAQIQRQIRRLLLCCRHLRSQMWSSRSRTAGVGGWMCGRQMAAFTLKQVPGRRRSATASGGASQW